MFFKRNPRQYNYNYGPWGETDIVHDDDGSGAANPVRYTGREMDGTGLYYYRARYYSPEMGRFISEDPIGFGGGDVNWYAYVGNNVINRVDSLGLYVGGVGAGAGGSYWAGSGSADLSRVWDDKGNKGWLLCYGSGIGISRGVGGYAGISSTNAWGASTICDMAGGGPGGSLGKSGGGGGAGIALNVAGSAGGVNINTGVGFGGWGAFCGWGNCMLLSCSGECCEKKKCED